jgi:hypothetical protein
MMVDVDVDVDDNNQTNTLENAEMTKSSLSTDNLRPGLNNHVYSDQRAEKVLRPSSSCCFCNINRIDNILKNMHSKWSNID